MSTPQQEPRPSVTRVRSLVRSVPTSNPSDRGEMGRVREQLAEVRSVLQQEGADVEDGLCGLASQLVDLVERHGQVSGRHALMLVTDILTQVIEALGGEVTAEERGPGQQLPSPAGPQQPSLGLRLMDQNRLGEILVSLSMLTQEQLERTLRHQKALGRRFGETLVDLGYLNKAAVDSALRMQRRYQGARSLDPWIAGGPGS